MSKVKSFPINLDLPANYPDLKDPSPLFDGKVWHIYATGPGGAQSYGVSHLVSESIDGPWRFGQPVQLVNLYIPPMDHSSEVCAPGVCYDSTSGSYEMFIHTHFDVTGGVINHLVSQDGVVFVQQDVAIVSKPDSFHAGVYDPQPAVVNGKKYLTYTAFKRPAHGNVLLAESVNGQWCTEWEHHGLILSHKKMTKYQNQHTDIDYEWGLEGAQLLELHKGALLMIGSCFLPHKEQGRRQRLFFAVGHKIKGRYHILGTLNEIYQEDEEITETGHGGGIVVGNYLYVFYQARGVNTPWRIRYLKIKLPVTQ